MTLNWVQIFRLGLVQMCLGAVVVLTTSTLNRLMVVELALPAVLPGLLVALHYGIQITRPNWGFRSDTKGNRTVFVIGVPVRLCGQSGPVCSGLRADRRGRRCLGDLAARAACHGHSSVAPRGGGNDHLADDDPWHCRHRRHRRRCA
jgi:hypothetical protein